MVAGIRTHNPWTAISTVATLRCVIFGFYFAGLICIRSYQGFDSVCMRQIFWLSGWWLCDWIFSWTSCWRTPGHSWVGQQVVCKHSYAVVCPHRWTRTERTESETSTWGAPSQFRGTSSLLSCEGHINVSGIYQIPLNYISPESRRGCGQLDHRAKRIKERFPLADVLCSTWTNTEYLECWKPHSAVFKSRILR